jgi:hypothetical protein
LFGGNSTTEPITLAAKFINISSQIEQVDTEFESKDSILKDDSNIVYKTKILSDDSVVSDSSFNLGITIGLIIGATIGIFIIFILRLKHEEKLNKVY